MTSNRVDRPPLRRPPRSAARQLCGSRGSACRCRAGAGRRGIRAGSPPDGCRPCLQAMRRVGGLPGCGAPRAHASLLVIADLRRLGAAGRDRTVRGEGGRRGRDRGRPRECGRVWWLRTSTSGRSCCRTAVTTRRTASGPVRTPTVARSPVVAGLRRRHRVHHRGGSPRRSALPLTLRAPPGARGRRCGRRA